MQPGGTIRQDRVLATTVRPALTLKRSLMKFVAQRGEATLIHHLVETQTHRTPDAPAVIDGNLRLTYRELDHQAAVLASRLSLLGVGPDVLVGVLLTRSARCIVAFLAVLKAGGAYVPFDPDYPVDRLLYMAHDAQTGLLITERNLCNLLADYSGRVLTLTDDSDTISPGGPPSREHDISQNNLAYVLYTSGSTGQPKGIAIEHRGATALIQWACNVFSKEETAGVLASTSMCFDLSIFEMFVPLSRGGTVILADNALQLPSLPAANQVTLINTVPSAMTELLRVNGVPASTRVINLAGEPLHQRLVRQIYELPTIDKVYNLYGPTEDTTYSTFALIRRDDPRPPSIGRPISNTNVYVLDRLNIVAEGQTGELYIAGDGLARGYLHRPDLTAERFLPDPFGSGGRLYRTGDLARWRSDGKLEFLGRLDQQVKIRGHRIELGEIESVLAGHADVEAAAVIARSEANGNQQLVAYLVAKGSTTLDVDTLRNYLAARLPDYMIPNVFVALRSLPLTPNGKVDRAALPGPEARLSSATPFIPPRTRTQELLAGIWSEVLKLPSAGIRHNFFALGGHSLLGAQVLSRVRVTLEVDLSLARLFDMPTIESMAAFIDAKRIQPGRGASPAIVARLHSGPVPCSFSQRGLWFFDKLSGANACYNIPAAFMISGALDREALERSLNWIVGRHESLRTIFVDASGEPLQIIREHRALALSYIDLNGLPRTHLQSHLKELTQAEASRAFDLSRGPLLRASLFRIAEEEHLLMLVVHHIIWDDWSARILYRELSDGYAKFAANLIPDAALPTQYADFVLWQQDWLREDILSGEREYWIQKLEGIPEQSPLPTDYPRPSMERFPGKVKELTVSGFSIAQAKALALHEGATLAMLMLSAFKTLLHRYSGETDMVVGWAIANRKRIETEETIGFFVDTQVIRCDLSQNPAFIDLLRRVKQSCAEAHEHSDMPFETLVRELNPHRNAAQNPIVQVLFTFQNTVGLIPTLSGLSVKTFEVHTGTSKMDLCFDTWEEADGLRCRLEYNSDLFRDATIERLGRHFRNIVEGVVANPRLPLSELPLLNEREQKQLLVEWQPAARIHARQQPRLKCIHELFEEQVERTPANIAVEHGKRQLTYRELDSRSNQLAAHLRKGGVGPETLVGVCMERSLELVVGLLGILKAGGAYVPLDPDYPQERLAYMLKDSRAKALLTEERLSKSLAAQSTTVRLDRDWDQIARESECKPNCTVHPENLAYVIYTSGSTGQPKGVGLSHLSLANHMHWMEEEFGFNEKDRTLQKTPLNFDASVWEFYAPLLTGGCLVMLEPGGHRDPTNLGRTILQAGISVVQMVPAVLQATLAARGLAKGTNLRLVMCGGERLTAELAEQVWTTLDVEVVNLYGPTEATIDAAYWRGSSWDGKTGIPIGRPIANTQIYIADSQVQLLPAGVPGEIYIGGDALARGYLRHAGLTAAAFVPNPFADRPGQRLYRTGDRGRYLEDGSIDYLGRVDHQIKIRGVRIELGEIESALSRHETVAESVVVARPAGRDGYRLLAYIVSQPGRTVDSKELHGFLMKWLPAPAVPSAFVVLDALPRTPHGKINRDALPEPGGAQPDWSSFVAPATAAEQLLAEIWQEVLGVAHVGIHDNFFDLGGHSLSATRVVARLFDIAQVELPLRSMFEAPFISQQAPRVENLLVEQIAESHPNAKQETRKSLLQQRLQRLDAGNRIPQGTHDGPVPLSFAQQHFWLLEQLGPGNSFHHSGMGIALKGPLNEMAMQASLNEILRRHEALRTVFPALHGEPHQEIQSCGDWGMRTIDLCSLAAEEQCREVAPLIAHEFNRPFDLERGPLFRAILLRLGPEDSKLVLAMHHIVFDGWSAGILLQELGSLYEAFAAGRKPTLPELPIQYADFSEWQRGWLSGGLLQSQLNYWRGQLTGLDSVELPFDRPRRAVPRHHGHQIQFSVGRSTYAALKSLSRECESSLFIALLTAFNLLLARYTGTYEQTIGSPVASRPRRELEGLIGAFTNTVVFRIDLSGDPTFVQLLRRVHEVAMEAYARQDLPFEVLVEKLQPERSLQVNPYFQTMFAQEAFTPITNMGHATVSLFPIECHGSALDLFVQVRETPAGLEGELIYDTDLFDCSSAVRLLDSYKTLLDGICKNPRLPISDLELMGPAMRHQVLVEWNNTFSPAERILLHHRFEKQAARTPDAVAVVDGDEKMTYGDLFRHSRALASHLRILGVGPESLVAVLVERTAEMVVAILGVLAAGGGYVPLDPAYPRDRLAYMLADSKAKVLLTQSHLREFLPHRGVKTVLLDRGWDVENGHNLAQATPDNFAYVLYTSGSTGRPKGVAIQHSSASKFVSWALGAFQQSELSGVLASTSLCFDLSVFEIYVPLSCGGTVIMARNAIALPELAAANDVTLINTVPSAMAELVALNRIPDSVRTVNLCGEVLHRSLADGIYARSKATRVVNLYGPTESTTYSTFIDVTRVADFEPPIGRPLDGTQVYLLDSRLSPVPIGAFGDLYLGGAGLARGYVGLPAVTAEKFVPNPFPGLRGSRLYATGDIARFRPNGDLEFLGRRDHQIKLRGFRIELGEIECALLRHEAVAEAVVAQHEGPGGMRLIAYVVPLEGVHLEQEELHEALAAWLPAHAVPSAFVFLRALPRTPNGKINRGVLPAPQAVRADASSFVEPSTSAELLLAQIWRDVLGIERVGVHDHFFHLGGHSLLATRVIAQLRELLNLEVPLRSVFEAPTIARLARGIERLLEEQVTASSGAPVETATKQREQA